MASDHLEEKENESDNFNEVVNNETLNPQNLNSLDNFSVFLNNETSNPQTSSDHLKEKENESDSFNEVLNHETINCESQNFSDNFSAFLNRETVSQSQTSSDDDVLKMDTGLEFHNYTKSELEKRLSREISGTGRRKKSKPMRFEFFTVKQEIEDPSCDEKDNNSQSCKSNFSQPKQHNWGCRLLKRAQPYGIPFEASTSFLNSEINQRSQQNSALIKYQEGNFSSRNGHLFSYRPKPFESFVRSCVQRYRQMRNSAAIEKDIKRLRAYSAVKHRQKMRHSSKFIHRKRGVKRESGQRFITASFRRKSSKSTAIHLPKKASLTTGCKDRRPNRGRPAKRGRPAGKGKRSTSFQRQQLSRDAFVVKKEIDDPFSVYNLPSTSRKFNFKDQEKAESNGNRMYPMNCNHSNSSSTINENCKNPKCYVKKEQSSPERAKVTRKYPLKKDFTYIKRRKRRNCKSNSIQTTSQNIIDNAELLSSSNRSQKSEHKTELKNNTPKRRHSLPSLLDVFKESRDQTSSQQLKLPEANSCIISNNDVHKTNEMNNSEDNEIKYSEVLRNNDLFKTAENSNEDDECVILEVRMQKQRSVARTGTSFGFSESASCSTKSTAKSNICPQKESVMDDNVKNFDGINCNQEQKKTGFPYSSPNKDLHKTTKNVDGYRVIIDSENILQNKVNHRESFCEVNDSQEEKENKFSEVLRNNNLFEATENFGGDDDCIILEDIKGKQKSVSGICKNSELSESVLWSTESPANPSVYPQDENNLEGNFVSFNRKVCTEEELVAKYLSVFNSKITKKPEPAEFERVAEIKYGHKGLFNNTNVNLEEREIKFSEIMRYRFVSEVLNLRKNDGDCVDLEENERPAYLRQPEHVLCSSNSIDGHNLHLKSGDGKDNDLNYNGIDGNQEQNKIGFSFLFDKNPHKTTKESNENRNIMDLEDNPGTSGISMQTQNASCTNNRKENICFRPDNERNTGGNKMCFQGPNYNRVQKDADSPPMLHNREYHEISEKFLDQKHSLVKNNTDKTIDQRQSENISCTPKRKRGRPRIYPQTNNRIHDYQPNSSAKFFNPKKEKIELPHSLQNKVLLENMSKEDGNVVDSYGENSKTAEESENFQNINNSRGMSGVYSQNNRNNEHSKTSLNEMNPNQEQKDRYFSSSLHIKEDYKRKLQDDEESKEDKSEIKVFKEPERIKRGRGRPRLYPHNSNGIQEQMKKGFSQSSPNKVVHKNTGKMQEDKKPICPKYDDCKASGVYRQPQYISNIRRKRGRPRIYPQNNHNVDQFDARVRGTGYSRKYRGRGFSHSLRGKKFYNTAGRVKEETPSQFEDNVKSQNSRPSEVTSSATKKRGRPRKYPLTNNNPSSVRIIKETREVSTQTNLHIVYFEDAEIPSFIHSK